MNKENHNIHNINTNNNIKLQPLAESKHNNESFQDLNQINIEIENNNSPRKTNNSIGVNENDDGISKTNISKLYMNIKNPYDINFKSNNTDLTHDNHNASNHNSNQI